jgi:lycopene beta-cyclase
MAKVLGCYWLRKNISKNNFVTSFWNSIQLRCVTHLYFLYFIQQLNFKYDYIITGSGCAGLSLLIRLLQQPQLSSKKILLIDEVEKNANDKTWCFWEKENGLFQPIVHHSWKELNFYSNDFSSQLNIAPYQYKMIRSIDFYNYVFDFAKQFPNVEFRNEKINSIKTENNIALVELSSQTISSEYIFNSILFENIDPLLGVRGKYLLLQHFKGWLIETEENYFDDTVATFMDFRTEQTSGTNFFYVLPVAKNKALIEYTLFSENILQQQDYENALQHYISKQLNIQQYKIVHEEFGIIPMTNYKFKPHYERIINIGVAGGQVKASSGYAFQFIQKRTQQIVESLVKNNHPLVYTSFQQKKFHWYDSTLLNVLINKKMSGDKIFASIFKKNKVQTVLKFLDNETNFIEDLKIMNSVPTKIFLSAALQEMI